MIDDVELDDSILEAIERDVASYREMRINAAKKGNYILDSLIVLSDIVPIG